MQSNFDTDPGLSECVKLVLYRPGRRFLPEVLRRHIWSGACKLALDVSKAIPVSIYNLTPSLTPFRYTMTSIHQSIAIWRRQPGNFSSAQNHHLELATGKLRWISRRKIRDRIAGDGGSLATVIDCCQCQHFRDPRNFGQTPRLCKVGEVSYHATP